MTNLDAYNCSLSGKKLVEAGAGTGKTYNIQILLLRLVLQGIDIRKILVVTFTDAATAELRDRTHKILNEMREALKLLTETNEKNQNKYLKTLAEADFSDQIQGFFAAKNEMNPWLDNFPEALQRVKFALANFDQAVISTIHGFCYKMLSENAFESQLRFGLEVKSDIYALMTEIAYDFFRTFLYNAEPLRILICNNEGINPTNAADFIKKVHSQIGTEIKWGFTKQELENCKEKLSELEKEIAQLFQEFNQKNLFDIFYEEKKRIKLIKGSDRKYFTPDKIASLKAEIAEKTAIGSGQIERFGSQALNKVLLKNSEAIALKSDIKDGNFELSSLVDKMLDKINSYKCLLYYKAYQYFLQAYQQRKLRDNFITYNEMITELHKALVVENSESLKKAIQGKFEAVLVDEFQDTDPVQYEIFNSLFSEDERTFFMIGDPKQAIYSFRGGDVFAYLKAKNDVLPGQSFTLNTNYRSTDQYIDDLNEFYSAVEDPFDIKDIAFEEIQKPTRKKAMLMTVDGVPVERALTGVKTNNAPDTNKYLVEKIQELVSGSAGEVKLDEEKISYGDIAILVRKGEHGDEIEKILLENNIPVVFTNAGSIFASEEAENLLQFLEALRNFKDARLINKVLSSSLFYTSADDLLSLQKRMPEIQQYFQSLYELWKNKSILTMFRSFLDTKHFSQHKWLSATNSQVWPKDSCLAAHIASQLNGEKILTNYNHLCEILQFVAGKYLYTPDTLLDYYAKNIKNKAKAVDDDSQEDEELYDIRMFKQKNIIFMTTIHKSKGLEFPYVIVPHLPRIEPKKYEDLFHEGDKQQRSLMIKENEKYLELAQKEAFQETLRLLYVALTRAQYGCFVAYSKPGTLTAGKHLETAFEAFVEDKTQKDSAENEAPVDTETTITEALQDLQEQEEKSLGTKVWQALQFSDKDAKAVSSGWTTCAYSSLSRTKQKTDFGVEEPEEIVLETDDLQQGGIFDDDIDEVYDNEETSSEDVNIIKSAESEEREAIFRFPAGKYAGLIWHKIFEELDFQAEDPELRENLELVLTKYSLLPENDMQEKEARLDAFFEMCKGILQNQLPECTFALKEILPEKRLTELRFLYKMKEAFLTGQIAKILQKYKVPFPENWDSYAASETAMTGSIDLLFQGTDNKYYLLDWKTNWLKANINNFATKGINEEMNQRFYHLQYLIYSVAFFEFYCSRNNCEFTENLYNDIFGGALYLFVRGIRPGKEGAVFFKKPEYGLLKELKDHIGIRTATPSYEL